MRWALSWRYNVGKLRTQTGGTEQMRNHSNDRNDSNDHWPRHSSISHAPYRILHPANDIVAITHRSRLVASALDRSVKCDQWHPTIRLVCPTTSLNPRSNLPEIISKNIDWDSNFLPQHHSAYCCGCWRWMTPPRLPRIHWRVRIWANLVDFF